ncbi:hypothetical protein DNTS_003171 [Danionella cerebrum]|uniref:Uncharacterized protein n=1 Tax=Danionella cerebrum TaxID=2873325 RepID=A0A553RDP4_9TELE|nr:hypothetical protein DNTS_003171 [Danionella translucida]
MHANDISLVVLPRTIHQKCSVSIHKLNWYFFHHWFLSLPFGPQLEPQCCEFRPRTKVSGYISG